MRLRHSRELIATVSRRWIAQYPETKLDIRAALEGLDPASASAADVARIIGNKSWSHFTCDECSETVEKAVEFSREYSDTTYTFCASCLRAAAALGSVVLP